MQAGTRTVEDFNDVASCNIGDVGTETLTCSYLAAATLKKSNTNGDDLVSERVLQSENKRDAAIILLKKEIECALESLQELQAQMDTLRSEKDEILASERSGRKIIESLINHAVLLRDCIDNFEGQLELQFDSLDDKMGRLEKRLHESFSSWFQQREVGHFNFTLCFQALNQESR